MLLNPLTVALLAYTLKELKREGLDVDNFTIIIFWPLSPQTG